LFVPRSGLPGANSRHWLYLQEHDVQRQVEMTGADPSRTFAALAPARRRLESHGVGRPPSRLQTPRPGSSAGHAAGSRARCRRSVL